MSLVRRFYPKRLTYSILWTIPTGAIWGEVSQGHNDMLTAVGFEPVLRNTNALSTAPHASTLKYNVEVPFLSISILCYFVLLLHYSSEVHGVLLLHYMYLIPDMINNYKTYLKLILF